jgi:hypothetical protein
MKLGEKIYCGSWAGYIATWCKIIIQFNYLCAESTATILTIIIKTIIMRSWTV